MCLQDYRAIYLKNKKLVHNYQQPKLYLFQVYYIREIFQISGGWLVCGLFSAEVHQHGLR